MDDPPIAATFNPHAVRRRAMWRGNGRFTSLRSAGGLGEQCDGGDPDV